MKKELKERILNQLDSMDGKVGFYFKNLVTGETFGYNEKEQFLPASIVKIVRESCRERVYHWV